MTERDGGYPQESYHVPSEFVMPSDSVLLAEAWRDNYESEFIHALTRTSDMPEKLFNSRQIWPAIHGRIITIKKMLSSPTYDVQEVMDEVDMEALSRDDIGLNGDQSGQDTIDEYQVEYHQRNIANIFANGYDVGVTKKALVKRFKESRRLADERGVDEEIIFSDQQHYFDLIKISTSPEDLVSQFTNQFLHTRSVFNDIVRSQMRFDILMASLDNKIVSIDDIDKAVSRQMDQPKLKATIAEGLLEIEDKFHLITKTMIERYWGRDTAELFD